jgi:hypothetical protein
MLRLGTSAALALLGLAAGCAPVTKQGETTSSRTCPDGTPKCVPALCSLLSAGCGNFLQCQACDGEEPGTGLLSVVLFEDPVRGLGVDDAGRVAMARGNVVAKHVAETPQMLWQRPADGVDELLGLTVEPQSGDIWAWGGALFWVRGDGRESKLLGGCGDSCIIRYVRTMSSERRLIVGTASPGTTGFRVSSADGVEEWALTAQPPAFLTGAAFRPSGGVSALMVLHAPASIQQLEFATGGAYVLVLDRAGVLERAVPLGAAALDGRVLASGPDGTLYVATWWSNGAEMAAVADDDAILWRTRVPSEAARARAAVAPDGTLGLAFDDPQTSGVIATAVDPQGTFHDLGGTAGTLGGEARPSAVAFLGNDLLVAGWFAGRVDLWGVSTQSDRENGFVVRLGRR